MDLDFIKRIESSNFRAMISLVPRCGELSSVDSREGLRRGSESPVVEHGPCQFMGSSCILIFLPTPLFELMFVTPGGRMSLR